MTDLSSLRERVKMASGPDREIDGEIAKAFGWTFMKMKGDAKPYWRRPGETTYYMRAIAGPPRFTGSVETVISFIETMMPDAQWYIRSTPRGAIASVEYERCIRSTNTTLALCEAFLRALEAKEPQS